MRRAEEIADLFTSTLPIYYGTEITVRFSRADTVKSIQDLFSAMERAGATGLDYRIMEIEESKREDASTVRLVWLYQTQNGKTLAASELKYFWGWDTDGEFRCLMVEYLSRAFVENPQSGGNRLN